jgi:putative transposase
MDDFKQFYRRYLPHFHQDGATYFVTTRLNDSLPKEVILKLASENENVISQIRLSDKPEFEKSILIDEQQRRHFGKFDKQLDVHQKGNHWLKQPDIVKVVMDAIHYRNGKQYELICYTIMSNHIHIVFTILNENVNLYTVLQRLKQFTATEANKLLNRKGEFWQEESYDRIVRDAKELSRIIQYVLNNPVKIGLVEDWRDYPFCYVNENYL